MISIQTTYLKFWYVYKLIPEDDDAILFLSPLKCYDDGYNLQYEDEDHDKVLLASDSDLQAAIDHAKSIGWKVK